MIARMPPSRPSQPPASSSPCNAARKKASSASPRVIFLPSASETSIKRAAQALISDVQLLQCAIATGLPAGVATTSISG